MKIEVRDSEVFINLDGRLDTAVAPKVDEAIKNTLDEVECPSRIVIDASDLSYISSSGLRVILGLRKKCENTEILNAQKDVLAVLELTGISKLLTVK